MPLTLHSWWSAELLGALSSSCLGALPGRSQFPLLLVLSRSSHPLPKQTQHSVTATHRITRHAKYLVLSVKNPPSRQHPFLQNGQKRSLSISSLAPAFQTERRSFQEALQSPLWPASSQRAPSPMKTKKQSAVSLQNRVCLLCFKEEDMRLANLGHDLRVWLSDGVGPLYGDRVPPHLDLAAH